jgi:hypothetical protein
MDKKEDPLEDTVKAIEHWIKKIEEIERRLRILSGS